MAALGLRILRFENKVILNNIDDVLNTIKAILSP
ncbi:very-short-patch-repair endonuclease [Mucilaginibacter sp. SG564]|nr:very-short-patch-repair endonuclease [Mucilaginibacter sp. SG564]